MELTNITIPTPEAYDATNPTQQSENFFYVVNQLLTQVKTDDRPLSDLLTVAIGGDALQALKDLPFNSVTIDFGPFQLQFDGRTFSLGEITS